jgi:hypothetical protein
MKRGRSALIAAFVAAVVLSTTQLAAAQAASATAAVRGRAVNPQGQGVAARVQLVQPRTGLAREVQADADGHFAFSSLPPGETMLTVTAPGLAEWRSQTLLLEVGQTRQVDVQLSLKPVQEAVTVRAGAAAVDPATTTVGSVISAEEIEALPLNGRNFLELAFLTPGSAPAPNFDPTKSQSVLISSAGQLGRGGNITIDGMDDNDDVVGGPLMNVPQDGIQEFQVATNRFSAEFGRSASSVVNVVTRSGGNALQGTAALFLRDQAWQALPATVDPDLAGDPPFDRQHVSMTTGGPIVRDRWFGFGAFEVRNQNGGVLVGVRDPAARTITPTFAPAPLDDLLFTGRLDWRGDGADAVTVRYSGQKADDISASTLERPIGTASQRQQSRNRFHALQGTWTRVLAGQAVNTASVSLSDFDNVITPVEPGRQLTFPSLQAGSSFRVPQGTVQRRWQFAETLALSRGAHQWTIGGQLQRVDAAFDLGVFRDGRVEFLEDFPAFDRNGDGVVNDNDLLFEVTLRSGRPDQDLEIADADNVHLAAFVQDDWRVNPRLTLNLGLRYELDTDVNNLSRVSDLNPLILPFITGERRRDTNNLAPRVGFNWTTADRRTSVRGGYGLYFDRVTLQIVSLERGLDGRALPIEVRAGNVFFVDPDSGTIPPFAPRVDSPFTGFILPGAGASGINFIASDLQNPRVQQMAIGVEREIGQRQVLRVDLVHNRGSQFIIGRTVGEVFNPVVDGPDRVVRLESSARTQYTGLLVELERRYADRFSARAAYTLSRAWNFANDDQIPFGSGPLDPTDLEREWGPTPNDRRHRLVLSGVADLGAGFQLAGLLTMSSGVPMDILLPGGESRVPALPRNAGGRMFETAAELNAFITELNANGGVDGVPLPLVSSDARFNDSFSSIDLRLSRRFDLGRVAVDAFAEVFNLFDVTNILGTSTVNYSGFVNALVRDSNDPGDPGFLTSSRFGTPVSTAGGVFGSGGPRALQLGARVGF